ncbi:synaptophysin-like protein 1 isoform X1 [Arapaima gigas]
METLRQKMVPQFKLDLSPLKEPLCFVRVLEWVFSIFAFATVGGYSGSTSVSVQCNGGSVQEITADFSYPFRLPTYPYQIPKCQGDSSATVDTYLAGDFSSSAEFFVSVGVLGFLYCTATLVVYLGYLHVYREKNRGPILDLVLTGAFAFLWLVSSSAWAKGLTDIKTATSPSVLVGLIDPCRATGNKCSPGALPSLGRLHASVIFGFLNLILWGGNCWFIYKETPFHQPPSLPAGGVEGGEVTSPPGK